MEIGDEFAHHRNIVIPARNTSNCEYPPVRYNLLCLNRIRTQAGKFVVKQKMLWMSPSRNDRPKASQFSEEEASRLRDGRQPRVTAEAGSGGSKGSEFARLLPNSRQRFCALSKATAARHDIR